MWLSEGLCVKYHKLPRTSSLTYKPPSYRSTRTHQHSEPTNVFTLKDKNSRAALWNKQRRRPSSHFSITYLYYLCIYFYNFVCNTSYFLFYVHLLKWKSSRIFDNGIAKWAFYVQQSFFGQKLSMVGVDCFSLEQIGVGWCSLMQFGAD